jgi:carbonic anhydrase/acetyltransferase-like protein (isoleucine patch superfamily)
LELAAIVVVPSMVNPTAPPVAPRSQSSRPHYSSLLPILGNDVLHTWMKRVRKLGVPSLWLTSSPHQEFASALQEFCGQGIERLLMIRLKSYAEMDLADLLAFHCQSRNSVTEVHDARGQLGISVFDQPALRAAQENRESSVSEDCALYSFHGYAKRILAAGERQELVGDALTGACAMRPRGREIAERVWVGENVKLADSVKVIGPTYIGDRAVIRAGATIGPFASVERDSMVDCGTTVVRATVLPNTYLASGLLVQHALVDGEYLEDLRCGIVADLRPAGLAKRMRPMEPEGEKSSPSDHGLPPERSSASNVASASAQWRRISL